MSDRDDFVKRRRARWAKLDGLLKNGIRGAEGWSSLARLYRSIASDLSRARSLDLPPDVIRYLEQLTANAHNRLYGSRRVGGATSIIQLVMVDFPVELRRQWRFFLLASLLFYGPFVVGAVGALLDQSFALAVMPESSLKAMEDMYSGDPISRQSGEDSMMAGFYVLNNVGIALRCFATGAFFGLGSVYTLVYNGVVMGVVEGYLWRVGAGWNLLRFTVGHTAWELTGVVVAGTAGMKFGWALVVTNGRTRAGSLKQAGLPLFRLVAGATAMLFIAAAIEAFWSASPVPLVGKLIFGGVQVVLLGVWLAVGGLWGERT